MKFLPCSLLPALLFSVLLLPGCKSEDNLTPISGFQPDKYLGRWYEIARLPTWFEKDFTNVTATYTLLDNGTIKVDNAGFQNKEPKQAIGRAKFAGEKNVGYLRVSFFRPFYADYKVIALDTAGYRYAMVASSTEYLWILCREPRLNPDTLKGLVDQAGRLGFDTGRLIYTVQSDSGL